MIPLRDNAPKGADPLVTVCLIAVCVLVYFLQLAYPGGYEESLRVWGEVPTRILAGHNVPGTHIPAYWTWLTSIFMHAGALHLIGNMLALWLFGDNIEWLLGRFRFLLFYLTVGVLANIATTFLGYQSSEPGIGASGAIAGVMAAYLIFYPRARVTSLMWINPFSFMYFATGGQWGFVTRNISALWYIGSWLALQIALGGLLFGTGTHINAGIYAHVAGALGGAVLVWPLLIQGRRPDADDPVVTDSITAPIIGDEGDGGSGVRVNMLDDELARLHGSAAPIPPIHDYRAEELLDQGDRQGALQHCREMLAIAQRMGEHDREAGYRALIDEITAMPAPQDVGV